MPKSLIERISREYEVVVLQYIDLFSKKQDLDFEFWVAEEVGEIACFGDHYYFKFSDIKVDLERNVPKHSIIDWLEDSMNREDEMLNS